MDSAASDGMTGRAFMIGLAGTLALLAFFVGVVSALSGWTVALNQFRAFRFFILALAIGFGVQLGLYVYLRQSVRRCRVSGKALALTGTTSTAAMVSCCTHYLANLLPILGVSGLAAFVGQYQVQLFWIGLMLNLTGVGYLVSRLLAHRRQMGLAPETAMMPRV